MLSKRIIACLDVRDGHVVKGVNFEGLRSAGDPAELARRYNHEGIDELVILDVTATLERRRALAETIRAVARELFIPLTVGGGIRTEEDGAAAVDAGADKVSLNTAALSSPALITTLANRYGSQAVIVAIDAKRALSASGVEHFAVYARSGQTAADRDAVEWAQEAEARGAGEILDVDRPGRHQGRLRLRDHRDCIECGIDSGHRVGRRRRPRRFRRSLHSGRGRCGACRVDFSLRRDERPGAEGAPHRSRHSGTHVNHEDLNPYAAFLRVFVLRGDMITC